MNPLTGTICPRCGTRACSHREAYNLSVIICAKCNIMLKNRYGPVMEKLQPPKFEIKLLGDIA